MTNGCLAFQDRHATSYVGQLVADIGRPVKFVLEGFDRFCLANKLVQLEVTCRKLREQHLV